MEKNVKLSAIRNAMKETKGSPFYCVKQLYVIAETCKELKAILPKKEVALANVAHICEVMEIGKTTTQERIKHVLDRENYVYEDVKTTVTITKKMSVDTALRYFVKVANGEIEMAVSEYQAIELKKARKAQKAQKAEKAAEQQAA